MSVDYAGYQQQSRNINTDYAAKLAANDYARTIAQQRGSRQIGDLTRGWSTGYPKFAASWGQRGARPGVNSGFYQQAMQSYVGDYQRGRNDLQQNLTTEQNQYNMTQTQLEAERQRALADLELQKQREIAALAANIQAARPYA